LVITKKFSSPTYIGDPINIVKIFNQKFADELLITDISCLRLKKAINYKLIKEMAGEAFMPVTYGGGIQSMHDIERVFDCGVERVCINSAAVNDIFLKEACKIYGSSSIVSVVDVGKNWLGALTVYSESGKRGLKYSLNEYVLYLEQCGVGEIIIQDIHRDGTRLGLNLDLLKSVLNSVNLPVIICGGAKDYADLKQALYAGAAGVAAGHLFAYSGSMNAVLINFPDENFRQSLVRKQ
jgi:cyclase